MKPRDVEHLRKALLLARGFDGRSLLSDSVAHDRAKAIWEEIHSLGFELQLIGWQQPPNDLYPAYKLNDPRYDLNSIKWGAKDTFAVNGPGISDGDLLKLGRALEMKREHLRDKWPKALDDHFHNHESHLDTIEELCWIDKWRAVENVKNGTQNPSTGKDIDWEFSTRGVPIGIEVKNRRKEWTGLLDGAHRSRLYDSWFDDFNGKFDRSSTDRLNLVCISTLLEGDEDLRKRAGIFLAKTPEVDGVVVYSSHVSPRGSHITIFAADPIKAKVRSLLKPVPHEDAAKVLRVQHLARNPSGGVINSVDDFVRNLNLG